MEEFAALTLSLPRVINVKFPLQPHQKYKITKYGELGFSLLTQIIDDYTTNSHYLTNKFLFRRLGECSTFLNLGVKGLTWKYTVKSLGQGKRQEVTVRGRQNDHIVGQHCWRDHVSQMLTRFAKRATFVADKYFVSWAQKMFLKIFRNISCGRAALVKAPNRKRENIGRHRTASDRKT